MGRNMNETRHRRFGRLQLKRAAKVDRDMGAASDTTRGGTTKSDGRLIREGDSARNLPGQRKPVPEKGGMALDGPARHGR